eukprot:4549577-Pyramimonas_sp.AAC.1
MPSLWIKRQWNASWACRRYLVHIWDIAPGALDRVLDQCSNEICPASPTKRPATSEISEEWGIYDMSTHLSPNSPAPAAGPNPPTATPDGRPELAPRPQGDTFGG